MPSFDDKIAFLQQLRGASDLIIDDLRHGDDGKFKEAYNVLSILGTDSRNWPAEMSREPYSNPNHSREFFVENLIERSDTVSLSAPPKARKSFILMFLSLCLISAKTFYGFIVPQKLRVGYINFELKPESFARRVNNIQTRLFPDFDSNDYNNLFTYNLRGFETDLESVCLNIRNEVVKNKLDIIILDPLYKMLISKDRKIDENSAGDMEYLISKINRVTNEGCAFLWSSHYSKGNKAGVASMERSSGSGVQSREPDVIITLTELDSETEQEVPKDYKMEFTMRDLPPIPSINLTWDWPAYQINDLLAGTKLKGANGRPIACTYADIVTEWFIMKETGPVKIKDMADKMGIDIKTIRRKIYSAIKEKKNIYNFDIKDGILEGKVPFLSGIEAPKTQFDIPLTIIPMEDTNE